MAPRSSFDRRSDAAGRQPWTAVWTPGVNLANFYNLYDSKGDVTISVATSIPTTLDGPIQVARYGALTVNAAMTASQRCRGLIVLSDSLSIGAAGSISMKGRGAAGAKNWAVSKDIFVPQSITFTGKNTSYADFLKWIRQTGYCIFDPSMYACPLPGMGDVTCDWATWTPYGSTIVSAAGCGLGGDPVVYNVVGSTGGAGTKAPGGGGSAANDNNCMYPRPGQGRPWGGGNATGGSNAISARTVSIDQYGGPGADGVSYGGGGAGNPGGVAAGVSSTNGGEGTGGILFVVVRGNVALTAGHALSADGMPGGNGVGGVEGAGGGGSGGGVAALFYSGSLTGTPSITAAGGLGGTGTGGTTYNKNGGPGGAGSTQSATFSTMGWAA